MPIPETTLQGAIVLIAFLSLTAFVLVFYNFIAGRRKSEMGFTGDYRNSEMTPLAVGGQVPKSDETDAYSLFLEALDAARAKREFPLSDPRYEKYGCTKVPIGSHAAEEFEEAMQSIRELIGDAALRSPAETLLVAKSLDVSGNPVIVSCMLDSKEIADWDVSHRLKSSGRKSSQSSEAKMTNEGVLHTYL